VTGIEPDKLAFLRDIGAHRQRHSGRTLYDHLLGTRALLARWECSAAIQDAGLFHSVLGTRYFKWQACTNDVEARLRSMVTPETFRWISLFSVARRGTTLLAAWKTGKLEVADMNEAPSVGVADLIALTLLECANGLEQGRSSKFIVAVSASEATLAQLPPKAAAHLISLAATTRVERVAFLGDEISPAYVLHGDSRLPFAIRSEVLARRPMPEWESRERRLVRSLIDGA